MPTEDYDARALALSLDSPTNSPTRTTSPLWSRRSTSSFRRTTTPNHPTSLRARATAAYTKINRRVIRQYNKLTPFQKTLFVLGNITLFVLGILFLIYNERIFGVFLPYAKRWRDVRAGWLVLWALIFVVSFPPLIGYSSLLTVAGFVYGFPNGWFIAASATVAGSTASFILSRSLLKKMVERLVAGDKRFAAFALTLKHDGLKLLIMIRLCPLPYSLTNGAVATFPSVHWASFALANAIVSPKLMLHIFIGAQLEALAESGGKMPLGTKALSYASIALGAIAGVATGWFMYRKTQQRAAQLEAEERAAGLIDPDMPALDVQFSDETDDEFEGDVEAGVLGGAGGRRERYGGEDDDISLRTAWDGEYRDEPVDVGDAVDIGDDPFRDGDAEEREVEEGKGTAGTGIKDGREGL